MNTPFEKIYEQLSQACSDGDLALFKHAFAQCPEQSLDRPDKKFVLYMGEAARNGYVEIVLFLLENFTEIDMIYAAEQAAQGAAHGGNIDSMKLMFDLFFRRGLDLMHCPVILHSIVDCVPVLEYLLSKWANPNALDGYGNSVFNFTSNKASIQLLVAHGADFRSENLLHKTLTYRSEYWEAHMKFLVNVLGVDINAPASTGRPGRRYPRPRRGPSWCERRGHAGTALHWAVSGFQCQRGEDMRPRARLLLEMGADVNALDDVGRTPMECAKNQEMKDIITLYGKTGKEGEEGEGGEEMPEIIGSGE